MMPLIMSHECVDHCVSLVQSAIHPIVRPAPLHYYKANLALVDFLSPFPKVSSIVRTTTARVTIENFWARRG